MRDYLRTIGAYLTGWLIAQSIFLRVWNHVMRNSRDESWRTMADDLAVVLADELESRRSSDAAYKAGPASYPHFDGDGNSLVLGPGVVASPDRSLITWQGDVYHAEEGMGTKAGRP